MNDLTQKCHDIASELAGKFTTNKDGWGFEGELLEAAPYRIIVRLIDGSATNKGRLSFYADLSASFSHGKESGRLHVIDCLPHAEKQTFKQKITVSAERSAREIAREVNTRLIKAHEKHWQLLTDKLSQAVQRLTDRDHAAQAAIESFCDAGLQASCSLFNKEMYLDCKGLPCQITVDANGVYFGGSRGNGFCVTAKTAAVIAKAIIEDRANH